MGSADHSPALMRPAVLTCASRLTGLSAGCVSAEMSVLRRWIYVACPFIMLIREQAGQTCLLALL